MKSQLISGGVVGYEGAPTSKRESLIARKAYEKKMQELESERTKLEESKAQVDRYKGLLQKQRDIMIALATRLNERDEAIVQMQEELDAYDKIHKDSESHVKNMRSRIRKLESHLVGHGIDLPKEDFHDDKDSDNSSKKSEGVKLDDVETLNVTYNNLLSPDEKILELAQIADRRKAQISELKEHIQQINRPPPQLSQALEENKQLRREAESYRMELNCLMSKQSNQSSLSRCDSVLVESDIDYVAQSVDEIIEKLSQKNNPAILQQVARRLLDLQHHTRELKSRFESPASSKQKIASTIAGRSNESYSSDFLTSSQLDNPPQNGHRDFFMRSKH